MSSKKKLSEFRVGDTVVCEGKPQVVLSSCTLLDPRTGAHRYPGVHATARQATIRDFQKGDKVKWSCGGCDFVHVGTVESQIDSREANFITHDAAKAPAGSTVWAKRDGVWSRGTVKPGLGRAIVEFSHANDFVSGLVVEVQPPVEMQRKSLVEKFEEFRAVYQQEPELLSAPRRNGSGPLSPVALGPLNGIFFGDMEVGDTFVNTCNEVWRKIDKNRAKHLDGSRTAILTGATCRYLRTTPKDARDGDEIRVAGQVGIKHGDGVNVKLRYGSDRRLLSINGLTCVILQRAAPAPAPDVTYVDRREVNIGDVIETDITGLQTVTSVNPVKLRSHRTGGVSEWINKYARPRLVSRAPAAPQYPKATGEETVGSILVDGNGREVSVYASWMGYLCVNGETLKDAFPKYRVKSIAVQPPLKPGDKVKCPKSGKTLTVVETTVPHGRPLKLWAEGDEKLQKATTGFIYSKVTV